MRTDLFAELLFAEFVERVELLGEDEVLLEAAAGQLHADDDGAVRDHHRHRPEVDLEILRQFLPARVARILRQQHAAHSVALPSDGGFQTFNTQRLTMSFCIF